MRCARNSDGVDSDSKDDGQNRFVTNAASTRSLNVESRASGDEKLGMTFFHIINILDPTLPLFEFLKFVKDDEFFGF